MYGNNGATYDDREKVTDLIGPDVERLVYLYSQLHGLRDFTKIYTTENGYKIQTKRNDSVLTKTELQDLADIFIADMIEQVVWCVEYKCIFEHSDAKEHLEKIQPLIDYSTPSIRLLFNKYWAKACSQT